jgi:hypothetical protein
MPRGIIIVILGIWFWFMWYVLILVWSQYIASIPLRILFIDQETVVALSFSIFTAIVWIGTLWQIDNVIQQSKNTTRRVYEGSLSLCTQKIRAAFCGLSIETSRRIVSIPKEMHHLDQNLLIFPENYQELMQLEHCLDIHTESITIWYLVYEFVSYICQLSDEQYELYCSSNLPENLPILSPVLYAYLIDAMNKCTLSPSYVNIFLANFQKRFESSEQQKLHYTVSTFLQ